MVKKTEIEVNIKVDITLPSGHTETLTLGELATLRNMINVESERLRDRKPFYVDIPSESFEEALRRYQKDKTFQPTISPLDTFSNIPPVTCSGTSTAVDDQFRTCPVGDRET